MLGSDPNTDWKHQIVEAIGVLSMAKDLAEGRSFQIADHTPAYAADVLEDLGSKYTSARAEQNRVIAMLRASLLSDTKPTAEDTSTTVLQQNLSGFFSAIAELKKGEPPPKLAEYFLATNSRLLLDVFVGDSITSIGTMVVSAVNSIWGHIENIQKTKLDERMALADMLQNYIWSRGWREFFPDKIFAG